MTTHVSLITSENQVIARRSILQRFGQVALALFVFLAAPAAWAAGNDGLPTGRPRTAVATFWASDYSFSGPDRIPAGLTTLSTSTMAKSCISYRSSNSRRGRPLQN